MVGKHCLLTLPKNSNLNQRINKAPVFKSCSIKSAKASLIRNFIIVLLKLILKNEVPEFSSKRQELLCALMAVAKGFDELYQQTMSEQLPKMAESLEDQQLDLSIFSYIKTISINFEAPNFATERHGKTRNISVLFGVFPWLI